MTILAGGDLHAISLGLLAGALGIYVACTVWQFVGAERTGPNGPAAPGGRSGSAFLALATLLVGLASLLFVMDPIFFPPRSYEATLDRLWSGLPSVAIVSAVAAFASSALGRSAPAALAFNLSMPMAMFAVCLWVGYSLLAGLVSPNDVTGKADLARYGTPILTALTVLPAAAFIAGLVAARLGRHWRHRAS